jgi:hypothetical protein
LEPAVRGHGVKRREGDAFETLLLLQSVHLFLYGVCEKLL